MHGERYQCVAFATILPTLAFAQTDAEIRDVVAQQIQPMLPAAEPQTGKAAEPQTGKRRSRRQEKPPAAWRSRCMSTAAPCS